jgi:hypothetical protein
MNKYVSIVLRIIVAIILLQTLYFKFTAHPESVYIFTKVGMEPIGRVGSGIVELIASVLLFVPGLIWLGALLAAGATGGAALFHLTILGIDVRGDGGQLFYMAIVVLCFSLTILWAYRRQFPFLSTN